MRCSKEIADIITDNLRTNNNIEMWNYDDLFKEIYKRMDILRDAISGGEE